MRVRPSLQLPKSKNKKYHLTEASARLDGPHTCTSDHSVLEPAKPRILSPPTCPKKQYPGSVSEKSAWCPRGATELDDWRSPEILIGFRGGFLVSARAAHGPRAWRERRSTPHRKTTGRDGSHEVRACRFQLRRVRGTPADAVQMGQRRSEARCREAEEKNTMGCVRQHIAHE